MIEYGVDTVVGPVPLPIRAKKIRPVKIVASDGTVKRVTDTEAILPLMYRVESFEVLTREEAGIKTAECTDCGRVFRKLTPAKRCAACVRKKLLCACGAKKSKESMACGACLTPEQRSEIARKARDAMTPEQRAERAEIARKARDAMTPEQRAESARKLNAFLTPEQRSEAARKGVASMTPEQRSEAVRKASAARSAAMTPEQRSESARKAARKRFAAMTPEQRSEVARKARDAKRVAREAAE